MPTLTATHAYDPADPVDAVVIGTGAGGSVILARLAAAGLRTVALEAGRAWNAATDFATDEAAQQDLYWRYERLIDGANPIIMGQNNSGIGVGGTTLHYTGFVPRAHPDDFRLQEETGKGKDWPLRYEDLAPFYERVEQFIGVSGPPDYPWGPERSYPLPSLPLNGAAELMKRGCDALGIKSAPAPNAALSKPYYRPEIGWRSACINRGFCECGCRTGARGSMDVTYLPYALRNGAEIRPECFVVGFDMERNGSVRAVRYRHQGQVYRQRCRHVFLCAGAVETPRLLLSAGLANSSGQVGQNLMAHPGLQVWGRFAEMVRPYKGFPCTLISEDMHRPSSAEFAGGYLLQSLGVIPLKYVGKLTRHGIWGKALFEHMTHFNQMAGINIAGECLPYAQNRISLSAERDETRLRKPLITFSYGDNELRLLQHAEAVMRRIMTAAGARDIWLNPRQAHVLGTCRMGNNAAEAVADSWGQSYDVPNLRIVDGSLFPSATATNPTLTILALAERAVAQFVQTQA